MKRLTLAVAVLLASCDGAPVNILETGCRTSNPHCFRRCQFSVLEPAQCVEGVWTCPEEWHLNTERDTVCLGKYGGPCTPDGTCDHAICGTDNQCLVPCGEGLDRCRAVEPSSGCCTETVIHGLCGVPLDRFQACPMGSMPFESCATGDAGVCGPSLADAAIEDADGGDATIIEAPDGGDATIIEAPDGGDAAIIEAPDGGDAMIIETPDGGDATIIEAPDGGDATIIEAPDGGDAAVDAEVDAGTPPATLCGNTLFDPGEECDDGNTVSNDGCSSTCIMELTIPITLTATLADSTMTFYCSFCATETFLYCPSGQDCIIFVPYAPPPAYTDVLVYQDNPAPSVYQPGTSVCNPNVCSCGYDEENGVMECSATNIAGPTHIWINWDYDPCTWYWDVFCGNGVFDCWELCDDGNNTNGDGCSHECDIEPGYTCAGWPSVCTP